jgi:hypothetical protein
MLLIPPVVSLVAWWILAPDPRFLAGAPWYLATSAILIGLTNLDFPAAKRFSSWVLVLSLVLALPIVITSDKFIPPGPQNGFFPLPGVETTAFVTTGGLTLQVPTGGDQCWGSSLLCTPSPDLNLTLLSDGDLQSGFAVVQSDK